MQDARARLAIAGNRTIEHTHQLGDVDRRVKPVQYVEEGGRLRLIVGWIEVGRQDHKQRVVDLRLRPQLLDQVDAVAIRKLQIDQNSGIWRRRYARNRLVCRKCDVDEKPFLVQPIKKCDRRLGIVLTKQYAKLRFPDEARVPI